MASKYTGRQRKRLLKYPYCYYCGIKVYYFKLRKHQKTPDNFATLEHLRSKYNKTRTDPNINNDKRMVLSCHKCNNDRSKIETASLKIEELWKRSKRHPSNLKHK